MTRTYLSLGSNIDAKKNLRAAARILRIKFPDIKFSSVYQTAPQDVTDQPDFLNAVAVFETDLTPADLILNLKNIEKSLAKNTLFRFGPRTIDLDLLLYGDLILPSLKLWKIALKPKNQKTTKPQNRLFIPHLKLHLRRFVLEPLVELTGGKTLHPVLNKPFGKFLALTKDQRCEKINIILES